MWPIRPDQITLRACHDFGWMVTAGCPNCRHSVGVNTRVLVGSKYGGEPIYKLLARGVFKHTEKSRGCDHVPADRLSISCMDVGMLKTVAEWSVERPGVAPVLVKTALQQGGRML